jgi:peptide/nickel transport system ATP-binding protein
MTEPLIRVSRLSTAIESATGAVNVVDDVSFEIRRGETLAIVGESGCGKSMTALSIMRLLPESARVTQGEVRLDGAKLLDLPEQQMRDIRGRRAAMIFQEPATSLNPVMTIGSQIDEVLRRHLGLDGSQARRRGIELLESVGLPSPAQRINEYPFQLSGGMKQRVMIAMALAGEPDLLIADEPTTALDVTIQAQVLQLLKDQQRKRDMAMLLITHDLGIVAQMAERVAVMYASQIVEAAPRNGFFTAPRHPYSDRLFKALPHGGNRGHELATIPGTVPDLAGLDKGCRFAGRCNQSTPICRSDTVVLQDVAVDHRVRCARTVELGAFEGPEKALLAATEVAVEETPKSYLDVDDLKVYFPIRRGILRRTVGYVKAVDGVAISIPEGRTLALVGESGCGKTTVGKAIAQLIPLTSGSITLGETRLDRLKGAELRKRRRDFQIIFQDPYASLDPRMRVGELLAEGQVALTGVRDPAELRRNSLTILDQVGMTAATLDRYPHEFSGGQRQRIAIARAIAVRPRLIVCDEPTSALDVSVQAQILNLLMTLQRELRLTYLFITHNIAVVEHVADEVAVMYLGRIVEQGAASSVLSAPQHPYTRLLLESVPAITAGPAAAIQRASGEMPSAISPPTGCHFHPRCPAADARCRAEFPPARRLVEADGRWICCWKPFGSLDATVAMENGLEENT